MQYNAPLGWKGYFGGIARGTLANTGGDHEENGVDSLDKESRAISPQCVLMKLFLNVSSVAIPYTLVVQA